jgi:hypothetical protein
MNLSKQPCYRRGPIRSLDILADALDVTLAQLDRLAENANSLYSYCPQLKKDGKVRDTWDANPQLKHLHELLNRRFLCQVKFPLYLQGGIRDIISPRDYVHHVQFHAGSKCAIALDIEDFFPSVTESQVLDIWHNFFRFSNEVAVILTKLTTKDGCLPQGAKTSNYLANLVFWRNEHSLEEKLKSIGWVYSRLTDDITISKRSRPTLMEESQVCGLAIGFIHSYGFKVKRSKLFVHRQGKQIILNSLLANVRAALPKSERNRIRAQVNKLAQSIRSKTLNDAQFARSTLGKLGKLKRFHPKEAEALRKNLPVDISRYTS